jgi:hypothetical protein
LNREYGVLKKLYGTPAYLHIGVFILHSLQNQPLRLKAISISTGMNSISPTAV